MKTPLASWTNGVEWTEGFAVRLPLGLGLFGGTDRGGHPFVAVAKRHDIATLPGRFLVSGRQLTFTFGSYPMWTASWSSITCGRLWVTWV